MTQPLLAKLADFKSDGDWSGTENEAKLRRYLSRASSIAEHIAGTPDGGLRRVKNRVFIAGVEPIDRYVLHLDARVIESVSEVIQVYSPYTDSDFDAETAGVLASVTDYVIDSAELGVLRRLYQPWYRRLPRCIRVTYTAGLADPARIPVALATATWTEATRTLAQVGAFASYSFAAGDQIVIESGTGVTIGVYPVASRTDDDAIVLGESISTAGVDLATGDITSVYSGVTDPPEDLQQGVIAQAMLLRNTADSAGLEKIDLGEAGGSFTTRGMKVHPALMEAARRYRRLL